MAAPSVAERWPELVAPPGTPEPLDLRTLRVLLHEGDRVTDSWEKRLATIARSSGALEVAIGEGLAALCLGERLISLGFSCLADYAREVLGLKERKAQTLAQLGRELRSRPLLRAAVRSGQVSIRKAQAILPVARGEAEARWVERARGETVRALEAAVREVRVATGQEEEAWAKVRVRLSADQREVVDEALELAGKVLPGSSRVERLEAIAQEYLGEHPDELDEGRHRLGGSLRVEDRRLEQEAARLEAETDRWFYLLRVGDVAAPELDLELASAREIDGLLRELSAMRDAWDGSLGFGAYATKRSGLWRTLGFASFSHYCDERLGLAARTVEQRAALEKRLWQLPALRAARDSVLSYEKVRLLSHLSDEEVEGWIPRAWSLTVVALRRELEAHEEAQMRAARVLRARVPVRVASLLDEAFRTVRKLHGRVLGDGECLVILARHFTDTWKPLVKRARTRSQKVRERDLGHCQVPGCGRRAVHAHHVAYRAQGGSDEETNLVGLCGCHHLRGIHGGHVRVFGLAPDGLVWRLGGELWTGSFRDEVAWPGSDAA